MKILKLGGYIRSNHLDLLAVLFAAIACYFAGWGIKSANESIRLAKDSAADTAKQIKASQEQLKASQDQLDLFRKNLDIAREQLDSFRQYERETFARPDFAIKFDLLMPAAQKVPARKTVFGRIVKEYFVEYGTFTFLTIAIQNTGAAPARNVTVGLSVTDMRVFNQLGDPIMQFEPISLPHFPNYPGAGLTAHYSVMHPGEKQQFGFPIQIKADAHDGAAQFFVTIEGDNLKRHYYQGLILRRSPKASQASNAPK